MSTQVTGQSSSLTWSKPSIATPNRIHGTPQKTGGTTQESTEASSAQSAEDHFQNSETTPVQTNQPLTTTEGKSEVIFPTQIATVSRLASSEVDTSPVQVASGYMGGGGIQLNEEQKQAIAQAKAQTLSNPQLGRLQLSNEQIMKRTQQVFEKLPAHLPKDLQAKAKALFTPQVIGGLAVIASAYGLAHASGAPFVTDALAVGALTAGAIATGASVVDITQNVMQAADIISDPNGNLDQAAAKLAHAINAVGIDAVLIYTGAKAADIAKKLKQLSPEGAFKALSAIKSTVVRQGQRAMDALKGKMDELASVLKSPFTKGASFKVGLSTEETRLLTSVREQAATAAKASGVDRNYRKNIANGYKAVAVAEGKIDGKQILIKGVSGEKNINGFAPGISKDRKLPTDFVGKNSRHADAEINILEQLLLQTNEKSSGHLKLIVDRLTCASCRDAIAHFNKIRPNINITVIQVNK
jgi:methylmalonyl-CoA mutase cobalamin-binding subunit